MDLNVLLLEASESIGGKVYTRHIADTFFDLGAVFPFKIHPQIHPIGAHGPSYSTGDIALIYKGILYRSDSPLSLIRTLVTCFPELSGLYDFFKRPSKSIKFLTPDELSIAQAFFGIIFPYHIALANPIDKYWALTKFACGQWDKGNQSVVFDQAQGSNVSIATRATATLLEQTDNEFTVTYAWQGKVRQAKAMSVILAGDALDTRKLLGKKYADAEKSLRRVQYYGGSVAALCFTSSQWIEFEYCVLADRSFSAVMQQKTKITSRRILLVYFTSGLNGLDLPDEFGDDVRLEKELKELGLLVSSAKLVFSERKEWRRLAPVFDQSSAPALSTETLNPTSGLYVAGDYTNSVNMVEAYGTLAAQNSGLRASQAVRQYLNESDLAATLDYRYLTDTYVYQIDTEQPALVKIAREGNIAFYGAILQAYGDEKIARYLLRSSKHGLWEYQQGFGVTAEDSAIVLEALLESPIIHTTWLSKSFENLTEWFYSSEHGAFHTISPVCKDVSGFAQGRAEYWLGPSVDATAHIALLMTRFDPDKYSEQINCCIDYIKAAQDSNGSWGSKWFPDNNKTLFYAIALLRTCDDSATRVTVKKAIEFVLSTQEDNGSWGQCVLQTSAAIQTLSLALEDTSAAEKAANWLIAQKMTSGQWAGEPLLQYWYDLPERGRHLYVCIDRGEITTARAEFSLQSLAHRTADASRIREM